jgi:thiosulfate dehydrogenase [quinone] large subunit
MALALNENTYKVSIPPLGRTFEFTYSAAILPTLLFLGRLTFGFYFMWSGFDKLITNFSAAGFLANVSQGPLKGIFVDMGTSTAAVNVIDPLVVWGQILIGFALFFGVFVRFALLMAATQMFLFYLPQLWPEHNPFLSEHIFYIGAFALLGALGAGRVLGLDSILEKLAVVKKVPVLNWLMG